MTMRFLKCVAVVTFVHLLAAMLVFGAYHFTKAGNQQEASASPSENQEFLLLDSQTGEQEAEAQARQHQVERGDSYWTIARKYNVSIDSLLKVNGHSRDHVLKIGETLVIPNP